MTSSFPHSLDIDLANVCNLRCSFCHLSYFNPPPATFLSFEAFQRHVGHVLPHIKELTLFSKYEPLICPDFVRIFQRVSEFPIKTYFSTNGVLLTDKVLDAIVGKLTYLTVSVTGFSRDSYKRYMGRDMFDRVKNNLDQLAALKRERNTEYPRLRISTVGMIDTAPQLSDAVEFARRYGAGEGVQVTFFIAYDANGEKQLPLADLKTFNKWVDQARHHAERLNVPFVLQSGSEEENASKTRDIGHVLCRMPWKRLSIQPNGDVYPCPVAYEPLANLENTSLEEIWAGKALKLFRKGVNHPKDMNPECESCTHCRHKSISSLETNSFAGAETFIGGMKRKTP